MPDIELFKSKATVVAENAAAQAAPAAQKAGTTVAGAVAAGAADVGEDLSALVKDANVTWPEMSGELANVYVANKDQVEKIAMQVGDKPCVLSARSPMLPRGNLLI